MKAAGRYRWVVVAIFFAFMLLHQADKLLIGPLTTDIMATFGINRTAMGAVGTGALIVGAVLYPLWGYLYDRYARAKLLALASAIWGLTTWLGAIAPTYPLFLAARASTGIDDSSYPGLYSLIADYFGPRVRGKIYGLLQLTQPLGYMVGLVLALMVGPIIGWRNVFLLTGAVGLVLAVLIFLFVREAPRGGAEPELAELAEIGVYRFKWETARNLLRRRTLIPLFLQGFFGVFPWNVISFWFFNYLETERGYSPDDVLTTMATAVLILAAGYFAGGSLGDWLFKRTRRGRLIVCLFGVITGAVMLYLTLQVPLANKGQFMVMLSITAFLIPFSSPNIISTVYDITVPEVRSTALSVQYFIESGGAALSPLMAGWIAERSSLGTAILLICTVAWVIAALFLVVAVIIAPRDINNLRAEMRDRAEQAKGAAAAG
ncbi:MAG: MFS transporter [Anaerolineae bacterium]|nr:MFS transporter [Anaerolineae bacterium]